MRPYLETESSTNGSLSLTSCTETIEEKGGILFFSDRLFYEKRTINYNKKYNENIRKVRMVVSYSKE